MNDLIIDAFAEIKEIKGIDKTQMMKIIEDAIRTAIKKKYGQSENFNVIINLDKGTVEILRNRLIVADENIQDQNMEIKLSEALKIDDSFEIDEMLSEPIPLHTLSARSIQAAKQTLFSRIIDKEKEEVYRKYVDRVGEIVYGEVYQVWKNDILIQDVEGTELNLPKSELIRGDFFRKGDSIKAVIKAVDFNNNNPKIILSRTDNKFLYALLETEVEEIQDGTIAIKKIVREPGEKAKIAVESYNDRIDPVGACVGVKGVRINGIVNELNRENIDVIPFTTNTALLIQRALAPAMINSLEIDEENKRVKVWLEPEQISLAIGKNGVNIKLASKLVGFKIDVYRDINNEDLDDEDIDLMEFQDEIEDWVLREIINVGCDTAKSVLSLTVEELAKRSDLEEETIREVMHIIKKEFEK
ncbi:MAG: transcription termination factor NusA [Chitinophagales bacterium]|jgi:N utilization substance protein A|nr:transcription termination factor NusA [Chitinophagales bacterium]